MKVAIVGAGASHGYTGSKTGVAPPLAKSIFSTFAKLDISHDLQVLIGQIICYVRDTRGVQPLDFNSWEEDIEKFLSEIHELLHRHQDAVKQGYARGEKVSYVPLAMVNDLYKQCIFLFASIINEIQNGSPCEDYREFASRFSKEDAFVTFNWDTLLDRALYESGKWSPANGYGIKFLGFFNDGWLPDVPEIDGPLLIKLHGSTNWLMSYMTTHLQKGEFCFVNSEADWASWKPHCFINATKPYPTYHNRTKEGYEPFSYYYYPPDLPLPDSKPMPGKKSIAITMNISMPEHGKSGPLSDKCAYPMIIPPVQRKEYDLFPSMKPLWNVAWQRIHAADQLEIIGYSFPPTDEQPWHMLTSAVRARSVPLNVILVDPYPERVTAKLQDALGDKIQLTVHKTTFAEYLKRTA